MRLLLATLVAVAVATTAHAAGGSRGAARRLAVQAMAAEPRGSFIRDVDGHRLAADGRTIAVASPRQGNTKPVRSFTPAGELRTSYGTLNGRRYAYATSSGLLARERTDGTVGLQRVARFGFTPQVVVKDWAAAQILLYP